MDTKRGGVETQRNLAQNVEQVVSGHTRITLLEAAD